MPKNVCSLKPGQRAIIKSVTLNDVGRKLCEMGCFPGLEVTMCYKGYGGQPLAIEVNQTIIALRCEEAEHLKIDNI